MNWKTAMIAIKGGFAVIGFILLTAWACFLMFGPVMFDRPDTPRWLIWLYGIGFVVTMFVVGASAAIAKSKETTNA